MMPQAHEIELSGPSSTAGFDALLRMVDRSRRLVVLSGAGCSTESGIPDYRDTEGNWKRTPPMQYQEFTGSHAARQRYWARALIGWRQFRDIAPNKAHQVLARLEGAGRIDCVITQNVDGLHQRAGNINVIDLHGRIDAVDCLRCRLSFAREQIQTELQQLNQKWATLDAVMAPDGDALLTDMDFKEFRLVACQHCNGPLKPAVVFFGEKVPPDRVSRAFEAVNLADALLVVGSSLMVFSGYRFVRAAIERRLPVGIINLGKTRADTEVDIKVEMPCAGVLELLEKCLSGRETALTAHAPGAGE
jgi:NAD-dependent SIR2 family protein deacetylase